MPFTFNIDTEKILASPFFVGMAGAIVALKWAPGLRWTDRVTNAAAGMLMAGFLTPAAALFFSLQASQMQSAIAFSIGLFGMNLAAAVNDWIRQAKLADVIPWGRRD